MAFLEIGADSLHLNAVKTPSSFQVNIYDESAPDSGRDITGLMHKNTIATKRTISLGWNNLTKTECESIMTAFMANEYFAVKYYDPTDDTVQKTGTFYLGDRSAPLYNWTLGIYSSVSFNIIER